MQEGHNGIIMINPLGVKIDKTISPSVPPFTPKGVELSIKIFPINFHRKYESILKNLSLRLGSLCRVCMQDMGM